ncbi:MAG: type VI secretion system tip protein TssI/VgrG [Desulfobacteraceae bacterium]|jgi:type VI secretion system secreted protein VgrG
MAISQNDRLIRIATPLGENTFIALSFAGMEEISELFDFKVELASERSDITFDQLAGKNVTVGIKSSDGTQRYFNGLIVAFSPAVVSENDGYSKYSAVIRPALWMLTQCYDCRIFQNKSVPDIIKAVLDQGSLGPKGVNGKIDYRLELTGSYEAHEYRAQYNESDHNFISRLCEEEGIFYFFEHENGKHTVVFADAAQKHKPHLNGNKETVEFQRTLGANLDKEVITAFAQHKKLSTGKYTARDYNFTIPDTDMTVTTDTSQNSPVGQGERYEYPGGYEKSAGPGETLAKIRMEADDVRTHTLQGRSNCRGFAAGFKFALQKHPLKALNGKYYVFTKVHHGAKQDFTTGGSGGDSYDNYFFCIPHEVPFRAQRNADKPLIVSSQTAIVTGPQAEEIHTDEHGRVKVKFFWDRRTDAKKDGNMSCWIRVSQNWAGGKWGAMHIPRVGQEVIVNFLDGNPDRPIITGRVYHGLNKPPYDLPAQKTKSTVMSNSTKNGNGNSNEIRFEDLKGSEEFFTHAAKDQNEVVENNMTTEVKANQSITIEKNRSITVTGGNETLAVESGGRTVTVKSNENHTNSANFAHNVSSNYTLKVNGNITIDASGIVKISGAKLILNG